MIPVLTLLGSENVGKTTIFNNLFNDDKSIFIKNKYKKYGLCYYKNFIYLLIDTISISKNYKNIEYILNSIIFDTDIILFVVDLNSFDSYINLLISNFIRKLNKYIFLLVNKSDNNKFIFNLKKINKLGLGKPFFISALHSYKIHYTIYNILNIYCLNKQCLKKKNKLRNLIISLIGKNNVGKTSFVKSILKMNNFFNKNFCLKKFNIFYLKYKNIYFNLKIIYFNNRSFNYKNIFFVSDIILFIIDPIQNLSYLDIKIYNIIFNKLTSIIFIINKSDLVNLKEKIFFKNFIKKKLNIKNFYILFISSLFFRNTKYIKYIIYKIYIFSFINFSTYKLNKIIVNYSNFLKIYYNYNIKINYIHQGGKNPILIIIHGKRTKIKKCYKLFLEKLFSKKLNIKSTFLKIKY